MQIGLAWLDRWQMRRDALLASAVFQRWASAFPLTRPIVRRRVRKLFDLCAGFVYSQVLLACVRLRLFELLAAGPLAADELAKRLQMSEDATARLLDAAVSLKLLSRRSGGRIGLGQLGAPLAGDPGLADMIEHHALLYADLADPVALLRSAGAGSQLGAYWPYAGTPAPAAIAPAEVAPYTRLMSRSQAMIAREVLAAYPIERHRCLLDVGGGDGSFLAEAAQRAPALKLMLFDLPPVAALAAQRFAALGLAARAQTYGGDFHCGSLPAGADAVALIRVVHDHDDAGALALLRAVRAALPAGGVLLLAEPMSDTRGAEPVADAYFGFYLLAMGRGRPRTPAALFALLATAGFIDCRLIPTRIPLLARVIVARVPAIEIKA